MSAVCLACLRPIDVGQTAYHRACLRALFETERVPAIDIEVARLHTVGLAMAGKTSLSGVQRKVSLGLSTDRTTLQVSIAPGRFILKPRAETFAELPENELTTMRLAAEVGLEAPPCALVTLKDGSTAYIVRRFDRAVHHKVHQEDFCQLAQKAPKEKYDGSAEPACASYAATPPSRASRCSSSTASSCLPGGPETGTCTEEPVDAPR